MAEKILDAIYALLNKYYEEQGKNTKTLVKEDYIHRKDAQETEPVLVKLLAKTDKAYEILFNGIENWIPKSTVHNDFEYKQDQGTTLIVDTWVLKKNFNWGEK